MLPRGINDNILVPHLSYLGLYQDKAKTREVYKGTILGGGWNQNPQKYDKIVVQISPSTLVILKYIQTTTFFNGFWV